MTGLVWANIPLALLFILAFAGLPLWMTFRHPETAHDHSHARAYLDAKAALAEHHSMHDAHGRITRRRHLHRSGQRSQRIPIR